MIYNLVYFLAGILTTVIFLSIKPLDKNKKINKRWSKIEKIEYTYDVDYNFKHKFTGKNILEIMNEVMLKNFNSKDNSVREVVIDEGDYSINCITTIRLIKRE